MDRGLITRSIIESIAARTAATVAERTGRDVRDVRVGSAEAAALGNAIAQGVALGTFASIDDGRSRLGGHPQ